jgi:ADP-ribose pyrophosphatase YjhB (NUDIX family)
MIIDKDLYRQIVRVMPISCVDLVVANDYGQVLLTKRKNEPAMGEWWFPGGRVHYLETRVQAAARKLREECGLEADQLVELGTFDVIVERADDDSKSHAITTLYYAKVSRRQTFTLDSQNSKAEWRLPLEWLQLELNPFIKEGLAKIMNYKGVLEP